jgi:hypothetical protein
MVTWKYRLTIISHVNLIHVGSNLKFKSKSETKTVDYNTSFKGKVVPTLPLIEHHATKAYWRSGSTVPFIL